MGSSEPTLSQDVVFDILSSPRRRYVLYYLRNESDSIELTELAEHVAAWENETEPASLTEQERKRVYVSLYQTHIPRLDEAGLVHYDRESGEIRLTREARAIDSYLETETETISWQLVYLGLAFAGALLLLVTTLGVTPLGAIPQTVIAGLVLLAFVVTAAIHTVVRLRERREAPEELRAKL